MPAASSGLRARSVGSALPPPSWNRCSAANDAFAFSDQFEGNQRAGALHLAAQQAQGILTFQPGEVHGGYGWVLGQPLGEDYGPRLLGAHPERQGWQAAVQEVGSQ